MFYYNTITFIFYIIFKINDSIQKIKRVKAP